MGESPPDMLTEMANPSMDRSQRSTLVVSFQKKSAVSLVVPCRSKFNTRIPSWCAGICEKVRMVEPFDPPLIQIAGSPSEPLADGAR